MPSKKLILIYLLPFFIFMACSTDSETDDREDNNQQEPEPDPVTNISGFTPTKADLGDTISIKGENFSRNFELLMNEMKLKVVFSNDSIIKFEVPYSNFNPFNFKVILNDQEAESKVFENPFELYEPKIDSISSEIGFKDKAVIYGSHLTNRPNQYRNIVYINNEMIDTEFQSKDSIIVNLRFLYLTSFENDLLVQAQLQEVRMDNGLKIAPPELNGINKNKIKVGDTLEVYGKYFLSGSTDINKVYIDGSRAEIFDVNSDTLWVKMPPGPYDDRSISKVRLELYTKEATLDTDLHLENTWYLYDVLKKDEVTDSPYVGNVSKYTFQEGNYLYLNTYMKQDISNYTNNRILQYDPATRELKDLPTIPIDFENYLANDLQLFPAKNGMEAYLYLMKAEDNFYRYNYNSGELTQLKDYPGAEIREGSGAVLNNKFYFGLGHTGTNSVTVNLDMYEYDIINNTWKLHSEMPFESDRAYNSRKTDFIWNNSLYTGNGSDWQYDFWKFNPTEGWVQKESIPHPISSTAYFQVNDKAFYYHQYDNEFWEYQRSDDSWSNRADLAIGKYRIATESAFVIGEYAYIIGYYNDYGYEESAAQQRDQLILRTEISNL